LLVGKLLNLFTFLVRKNALLELVQFSKWRTFRQRCSYWVRYFLLVCSSYYLVDNWPNRLFDRTL